jgi:hypothetical protein
VTDQDDIESFFADKSYDEVLTLLPEVMPRVGEVLQRAHDHRSERVRTLFIHKRLHGLENLFWYLEASRDEMAAHPTMHRVAFLIERVRANYEMGIEAALSEMRDLVFNAMRDVMEIEYLLTDFTHNPEHIDEWLGMPFSKPMRKFSAAQLRERQAKRLGIKSDDLPTKRDYDGHSKFLHANPFRNPMGPKGVIKPPRTPPEIFLTDSGFWDMYQHGFGMIAVIREFFLANEVTGKEEIFSDDHLRGFFSANAEVMAVQEAFLDGFMRNQQ